MDRAALVAALAASQARAGDVVYVERRGEEYRWERLAPGAVPGLAGEQPGATLPDAWIFYSGPWHAGRRAIRASSPRICWRRWSR